MPFCFLFFLFQLAMIFVLDLNVQVVTTNLNSLLEVYGSVDWGLLLFETQENF